MKTSLVGSIVACLLLVGCGKSSAPAAPAAAEAAKADPKKAAKAAATPASAGPELVYQYNPVGKRDPFRSALSDGDLAKRTGKTLCTDPLCQWDLDQLTLVAVVTGDANPIAMVEDPSGRGHIIRRNSKVGKQDGRVGQILRDSVIVTEYWQGPDGKTKPNPVAMKLKQDLASIPPVDMLTGQPYQ
jgi:type IV pilus assembly protein PilP